MPEVGGSNPSPATVNFHSYERRNTTVTPAIDYSTLSDAVMNTLPALFAAVVTVFTAVLVPKFALRIGKYAIGKLSKIAGGS
jgi:hypothetical protein